jgi:hypothetical protein
MSNKKWHFSWGNSRGRSTWADPQKMKVEISNEFLSRTERPKRMVPEEWGAYRRRYKKDG